MIGRIGDDEFGGTSLKALQHARVDTACVVKVSGCSAIPGVHAWLFTAPVATPG
jgi:hypothetical protein